MAPTVNALHDEGQKARHWREQIVKLSIKQLSELTGYSVTAIRHFEDNANSSGKSFGGSAWCRYRMACSAAHEMARGRMAFWWGQ